MTTTEAGPRPPTQSVWSMTGSLGEVELTVVCSDYAAPTRDPTAPPDPPPRPSRACTTSLASVKASRMAHSDSREAGMRTVELPWRSLLLRSLIWEGGEKGHDA